jgi:hypothetical protein
LKLRLYFSETLQYNPLLLWTSLKTGMSCLPCFLFFVVVLFGEKGSLKVDVTSVICDVLILLEYWIHRRIKIYLNHTKTYFQQNIYEYRSLWKSILADWVLHYIKWRRDNDSYWLVKCYSELALNCYSSAAGKGATRVSLVQKYRPLRPIKGKPSDCRTGFPGRPCGWCCTAPCWRPCWARRLSRPRPSCRGFDLVHSSVDGPITSSGSLVLLDWTRF